MDVCIDECFDLTDYPVHLATGEARLTFTDLKSHSLGTDWEYIRSYGNLSAKNTAGPNGFGWATPSVPSVKLHGSGATLNFGPLRTFPFQADGSGFKADFYFKNLLTLSHAGSNALALKSPRQRTFTFGALTSDQSSKQLVGITEANGAQVSAEHESGGANRLLRLTRPGTGATAGAGTAAATPGDLTTGLSYTYDGDSTRIASVTMQVEGQPVERAVYIYYPDGAPNGTTGDLQTSTRQRYDSVTATWATTGTSYYRYYVAGEPGGFEHALRYIVDEEGFARMQAAGMDPLSAEDMQLAAFADKYFEYDREHRVALERVRGGSVTYAFTYSANLNPYGVPPPPAPAGVPPATGDFNSWWTKTVVTRSDNTQETAYGNMYGQAMLRVFKSAEGEWCQYRRYNGEGRIVLRAKSSAVAGYDETLPWLVTLYQNSGWVQMVDLYATAEAGGAPGRLQTSRIREGEAGSDVLLRGRKYVSREADGRSYYFVAEERQYVGAPGSGDVALTNFTYAWYDSTAVVQQRTTALPAVPAAQNGSGVPALVVDTYDTNGNRTSVLDERGITTQWTWDTARAAVVQEIVDVAGLHLVTDYTLDNFGRTLVELGPPHTIDLNSTATAVRRARWTLYLDSNLEERSAAGYVRPATPGDAGTLVNPVSIRRYDHAGRTVEQIEAERASLAAPLSATDVFAQTQFSRWAVNEFDNQSRLSSQRTYHHIPASGSGAEGFDFARTVYSYDALGRRTATISPSGTISLAVLDTRGRVVSAWVGTDDSGATAGDPAGAGAPGNNMVQAELREYDRGVAGGDDLVTEILSFVGASQIRSSTLDYDYRGFRTVMRGEGGFRETYVTDLSGAVTRRQRWNDTGVPPVLVSQDETLYDLRGRVYRTIRYSIDPVSGAVGVSLPDDTWYDPAGRVVKRRNPEDAGFEKFAYDAAGRVVNRYAGYNTVTPSYAEAQSVVNDTIFEQTDFAYDAADNLIAEATRERFHNTTGLGPLGGPVGSPPNARVLYQMYYPDALGRVISTANFGTNGGTVPARPATAPAPGSTILVSTAAFNARGELAVSTDPNGTGIFQEYDDAGRLIKTIENFHP